MKESLASSNTFADIVSDPWHYNVSLYMFTNLMDKLGPQQAGFRNAFSLPGSLL